MNNVLVHKNQTIMVNMFLPKNIMTNIWDGKKKKGKKTEYKDWM